MTKEKMRLLDSLLRSLGGAAVAYSGGVDSTLLAAAAFNALGDGAVAVTLDSPTLPSWEMRDARSFAAKIGIRHVILPVSELNEPEFVANGRERCYYCKKFRLEYLNEWAGRSGIDWILDGSNTDDLSDYRPGSRALSEFERVLSPFLEVGMSKVEVREALRDIGLPTCSKPSSACLASRLEYGLEITPERLEQIESAEKYLRSLFPPDTQIRVRHHGTIARIEIPPRLLPLLTTEETSSSVSRYILSLGFKHVALDLSGYMMGSLNDKKQRKNNDDLHKLSPCPTDL